MSIAQYNQSDTCTHDIRVQTESFYIGERSDPKNGLYFFAYKITIRNEGPEAARLVSRYWRITDGLGRAEEVEGPGVVGEQPRIEPGQKFEYTSFCPLPTDRGVMKGFYKMARDDGSSFEVVIGAFRLFVPHILN